jgi:hypothetical protein
MLTTFRPQVSDPDKPDVDEDGATRQKLHDLFFESALPAEDGLVLPAPGISGMDVFFTANFSELVVSDIEQAFAKFGWNQSTNLSLENMQDLCVEVDLLGPHELNLRDSVVCRAFANVAVPTDRGYAMQSYSSWDLKVFFDTNIFEVELSALEAIFVALGWLFTRPLTLYDLKQIIETFEAGGPTDDVIEDIEESFEAGGPTEVVIEDIETGSAVNADFPSLQHDFVQGHGDLPHYFLNGVFMPFVDPLSDPEKEAVRRMKPEYLSPFNDTLRTTWQDIREFLVEEQAFDGAEDGQKFIQEQ